MWQCAQQPSAEVFFFSFSKEGTEWSHIVVNGCMLGWTLKEQNTGLNKLEILFMAKRCALITTVLCTKRA